MAVALRPRHSFVLLACSAIALVGSLAGCSKRASDDDPQAQSNANAGTSAGAAGNAPGASGSTSTANEMSGSGSPAAGSSGAAGTGSSGASGTGAAAGTGSPVDMSDAGNMPQGDAGMVGPASGPFPPVTSVESDGPFTATTMSGVGPDSNYTVYLPTELAPDGAKNPIVVWMSGGGTGPDLYVLLPHLATHGFVVIASNTLPGIGAEAELGQELVAGIDWALAENQRADGMLFGKLDETKIASMGYSMGSLATFTIADDPRLTTTVHISGGNMEPDRVNKLHAPAAFFCGDPGPAEGCDDILSAECDIAGANCATDFMNATTPVFYGVFPYGHLGILTDPFTTRIGGVVTGWLRWKLMSDETLSTMFVGDQCTLCSDSNWKVQQKGL